ncbi:MAG: thioredoxin fold domain-containing protein [Phycisphaerae bacterium]
MIDNRSGLFLSALIACVGLAGCASHSADGAATIQSDTTVSAAPSAQTDPPAARVNPTTNGHPAAPTADAKPKVAAKPAVKPPSPTKIEWVTDWDTATQAAKKTGKFIMVDFYTDWCGWCKKLDRDTYTDKKIIQLSTEFIPVKLNAQKAGKDLARKNKVRGYPTILFFDAKGKAVGRISGYLNPEKYLKAVRKIQKRLKSDASKA